MNFKIITVVFLFSALSSAAELSFEAEKTIYKCPPGAAYPIIECEELEKTVLPLKLELADLGDGYFQGNWEDFESAHFEVLASVFDNIYTGHTLSLNISAGYNESTALNNGVYSECDPFHPPFTFLVQGSPKPEDGYELVPVLVLTGLKYSGP